MQAILESFFLLMGVISTILFIVGFLLKARGITFIEFFPKKENETSQNIVYNNVISQIPHNSFGVDYRKVAAIIAAIKYHNEKVNV
ncbi:hypothetical protein FE243_04980 [Aliarcobacter thereius]|uniref:hypothetical protein n=1 Tax=Aliarcobacter thereius TaxID=544718 RepID=UPI0010FD2C0F|nr:hypothetical protein [Aliarcobacter thereius]TLT07200.1 hypothetical protein FE243_04980 [Aliarcobacter thereius]